MSEAIDSSLPKHKHNKDLGSILGCIITRSQETRMDLTVPPSLSRSVQEVIDLWGSLEGQQASKKLSNKLSALRNLSSPNKKFIQYFFEEFRVLQIFCLLRAISFDPSKRGKKESKVDREGLYREIIKKADTLFPEICSEKPPRDFAKTIATAEDLQTLFENQKLSELSERFDELVTSLEDAVDQREYVECRASLLQELSRTQVLGQKRPGEDRRLKKESKKRMIKHSSQKVAPEAAPVAGKLWSKKEKSNLQEADWLNRLNKENSETEEERMLDDGIVVSIEAADLSLSGHSREFSLGSQSSSWTGEPSSKRFKPTMEVDLDRNCESDSDEETKTGDCYSEVRVNTTDTSSFFATETYSDEITDCDLKHSKSRYEVMLDGIFQQTASEEGTKPKASSFEVETFPTVPTSSSLCEADSFEIPSTLFDFEDTNDGFWSLEEPTCRVELALPNLCGANFPQDTPYDEFASRELDDPALSSSLLEQPLRFKAEEMEDLSTLGQAYELLSF